MGTETMKAFIITAPWTAGVQVTKRWALEVGEVLVPSKAVAICTSERRLFSGNLPRYPAIGGHELAGVVEWADERQSDLKPGDRVAVDVINPAAAAIASKAAMTFAWICTNPVKAPTSSSWGEDSQSTFPCPLIRR